jgi:hypothetical protein
MGERKDVDRKGTYRLEEGPTHVVDEASDPLPGHYEVVFSTDGGRVRRFLTDKGRAAILGSIDEGQRDYSEDEIRELTVEPEMGALTARMDREAGEGA